ncbi:MAG: O-antigen ligase family protein [Planctomycetota bacterium]
MQEKPLNNLPVTYSRNKEILTILLMSCIAGVIVALSMNIKESNVVLIIGGIIGTSLILWSIKSPEFSIYLLFILALFRFRVPTGSISSLSSAQLWLAIITIGCFFSMLISSKRKTVLDIELLMGLFIIWALFTLYQSIDFSYGLKQLILWALLASSFWVAKRNIRDKHSVQIVLYLFMALGIFVVLTGIMQFIASAYFGIDKVTSFISQKIMPLFSSEATLKYKEASIELRHKYSNWDIPGSNMMRLISIFFSPITAGTFLGMTTSVSLALVVTKKKNWWFRLLFATLAAGVILTFTRGAYVTLAITLTTIIFIQRERKLRTLVSIAFAFIILVAVFLVFSLNDAVTERAFATKGGSYTSLKTRSEFLMQGITIMCDHPIKGVGFANYRSYVKGDTADMSGINIYPHNQYVQLGAEVGLVGVIFFIAMIAFVLMKSYKVLKKSQDNFTRTIATASFGAVLFYAIHAMFEDIIWIPEIMIPLWIMASLPFIIEKINSTETQKKFL